MTLEVFLQLLLLSIVCACLVIQTVSLNSTTQAVRQLSKRADELLPQGKQLIREATRTLEEGREILHRANRATHGVEELVDRTWRFFTDRFGNGARVGPRRGVVRR